MALDLSDYTTAAGAAKALANYLEEEWDADVFIVGPDEIAEYRDVSDGWLVSWEGGPFEWSIWLTGGASMFTHTLGSTGEPEVTGFYESNGWIAEPYYPIDLVFTNQ